MHRLLADSFVAVLDDVWDFAKQQLSAGATDDQVRAWLHKRRLDQHGAASISAR
jgi:hypothetical protein